MSLPILSDYFQKVTQKSWTGYGSLEIAGAINIFIFLRKR